MLSSLRRLWERFSLWLLADMDAPRSSRGGESDHLDLGGGHDSGGGMDDGGC
jgi:hypothetical protein